VGGEGEGSRAGGNTQQQGSSRQKKAAAGRRREDEAGIYLNISTSQQLNNDIASQLII
jgi:hypothetical protein